LIENATRTVGRATPDPAMHLGALFPVEPPGLRVLPTISSCRLTKASVKLSDCWTRGILSMLMRSLRLRGSHPLKLKGSCGKVWRSLLSV
jgi:hypothetical protein